MLATWCVSLGTFIGCHRGKYCGPLERICTVCNVVESDAFQQAWQFTYGTVLGTSHGLLFLTVLTRSDVCCVIAHARTGKSILVKILNLMRVLKLNEVSISKPLSPFLQERRKRKRSQVSRSVWKIAGVYTESWMCQLQWTEPFYAFLIRFCREADYSSWVEAFQRGVFFFFFNQSFLFIEIRGGSMFSLKVNWQCSKQPHFSCCQKWAKILANTFVSQAYTNSWQSGFRPQPGHFYFCFFLLWPEITNSQL